MTATWKQAFRISLAISGKWPTADPSNIKVGGELRPIADIPALMLTDLLTNCRDPENGLAHRANPLCYKPVCRPTPQL